MNDILSIKNLSVSVGQTPILHGVNLEVAPGTVHALMGPNGSGKSSLALTLMGHQNYTVDSGSIDFNGALHDMPVHKRARQGIFLSFQHPYELPGVPVAAFLKAAYESIHGHITPTALKEKALAYCDLLHIDHALYYRNLNEGFSGGQKKKFELLQMLLLKPKIALLDEIDSGLDVDALKVVAQAIAHARVEHPSMAIVLISHYRPLLDYIVPDVVHIIHAGRITHVGGPSLVQEIDAHGYERFMHGC